MHFALRQTVAPPEEPVTLAECKTQLRVDHSDDDGVISALISAARGQCEVFTGRQIVTATHTLTLDFFPYCIEVPKPRLQSVSSIVYLDSAGTSTTLSSSLYRVDTVSEPGRITPAYGQTWPTTYDVTGAITITFVAGYGMGTSVPEAIKRGIILYVRHLYDQQVNGIINTSYAKAAENLWANESIGWFR